LMKRLLLASSALLSLATPVYAQHASGSLTVRNALSELSGNAATARANIGALGTGGGTMTGTLVSPKVTLSNAPSAGTDATNKTYVDAAVAGAGSSIPGVTVFSGTCDDSTDNGSLITTLNSTLVAGDTLVFPPEAKACDTSVSLQPIPGVVYWAYYGTVTIKPTATSTASPLLLGVANASGPPLYIHGLIFDGGSAEFTASATTAGALTVSNVLAGEINPAKVVVATGIPSGDTIASQTSGTTGGDGVYQLTTHPTATVASEHMISGVAGMTNTLVQCFDLPNLQLDHIAIHNTMGLGGFMNGCANQTLEYSDLAHIGDLWYATGVASDRHQGFGTNFGSSGQTNIHWDHNTISDIGLDAFSPNTVDHSTFSDNTATLNNNGLSLSTTDYSAFVYCEACSNVLINGNVVDGASGNGLDLFNADHVTANHNHIYNSGEAGIGVFNAPYTTIEDNQILDSGQLSATALLGAISVTTTDSNLVVEGNTLSDDQGTPTQQFGLWAQAGTSIPNSKISGNVGSGNTSGLYGGLFNVPSSALSSCGTSPAIVAGSTREKGAITMGSGATTCTLTFPLPFTTIGGITVTPQSALALGVSPTGGTAITITGTGMGGTVVRYGVDGQ
jgi:Right handed beta helix region